MAATTEIAIRYLKAGRENRYFSWIATLSVVGIAIGIAAMIVVLSVIDGFENELRNRFLAANAHIMAYRYPAGLQDPERWESLVKADFGKNVKGVSPFVHAETMARKTQMLHAMLIKGIDPAKRVKVQDVTNIVRPLSALTALEDEVGLAKAGKPLPQVPAIIVGVGLLKLMQAAIGDTIELISPGSDDPFGQFRKYRITGVYDSGLQHYDNQLGILSVPAAQELFHMGKVVTGIEIGLYRPEESVKVADAMAGKYSLSIKEWRSYNSNIFEAMENERVVIGLIVWLVALVAGFNILTTLFVSVNQKQRDISVLKALGATNSQILALFFKQSMLVGALGTGFGVVLAYAIGHLLKSYQFVEIPEVYLLATLPVAFDPRVYMGVAASGLLICAIAGLYPSWAATRVTPTEGLTGTRSTD
jgi:lipoprotein-releasing system permease protein